MYYIIVYKYFYNSHDYRLEAQMIELVSPYCYNFMKYSEK